MTHARVNPTCINSICSLNQFQGLDDCQAYDPEVLASLNSWAHKVRVKPTRQKRAKTLDGAEIDRAVKFISSNRKPREQIVIAMKQVSVCW